MRKCEIPTSSTAIDKCRNNPKIAKVLEELIDEKCNLLSKSGVSKEGSVHLAQWMKGQFNKNSIPEFEEDDSRDWSAEEVVKRSKELQLMHEIKKIDESEDEQQSQKSQLSASKSTTSGSQVRNNVENEII